VRVLFVSSGNHQIFRVSPIIAAQADTIRSRGVELQIFPIVGKGFWGYLKRTIPLFFAINKGNYDLVHAHYSLCGMVAWLASLDYPLIWKMKKPVIVSLMGSDVKQGGFLQRMIHLFVTKAWDTTIVKSKDMKQCLGLENPIVIPNGVNTQVFKILSTFDCKQQLAWDIGSKHILFGADPQRPVKNYALAQKAYPLITTDNCEFHILGSIPHADIPIYLNACDVLLLTSRWEGSPNIVKEAMACGTPIVCTDVGDVRWLLDGIDGCFISSQDPVDIAKKLDLALMHIGKTNGRDRLIELGLDADSISNRIVGLYEEVLKKRRGN